MGDFKINEKTVFTQSGSAEPAMGSTITDIPSAGLTGTIPSGVSLASATFPTGHIINSHSKQFAEIILSTSGTVQYFHSDNDCIIGTVEAGVTVIALISGGSMNARENGTNSGTIGLVKIGPTSDFVTYLGGGGDSGGGSGADMDMYFAPFVMGARYFSSQTDSVVVRGGCRGHAATDGVTGLRFRWKGYVWNPITTYAFQMMGDHKITVAT